MKVNSVIYQNGGIKKMDKYGLIGGSTVNFMADKINEKLTGGEIMGMACWSGIEHFQSALKANRVTFKQLEKIMVLDGAFVSKGEDLNNKTVAKRALNSFIYLEGIVKRELEGVYLVLYTKSPILNAYVKSHHEKDRITKYKGTVNLLTTSGYQADGIATVLSTLYTSLEGDDEQEVTRNAEAEMRRKVEEQVEIYKLVGQREELRSQIDILNKRLDLVDRQLNGFLLGDRGDDLDVASELLSDNKGVSGSLLGEIESLLNN